MGVDLLQSDTRSERWSPQRNAEAVTASDPDAGAYPKPDYFRLATGLPRAGTDTASDHALAAVESLVAFQLGDEVGRYRRRFVAKRALDIFGAAVGLVVFAIPFLIVALLIRLSSKGPAFFIQPRVGRNGRIFHVVKFRTMYTDMGDRSGVAQTVKGDPRVTPLGHFLRRWNIDELPQLWNVLVGDMSLIGPRAHPVGMLAAGIPYEQLVPLYPLRHLIRPGITGLAQVLGYRGETRDADTARARIGYDIAYIGGWSVGLDLRILVRTLMSELPRGTGY